MKRHNKIGNLLLELLPITIIVTLLVPFNLFANNETIHTGKNSRTISFSRYKWTVKSSNSQVGPGPNYFSDSKNNVWVDNKGRLHLKITKSNNKWHCAEVISHQNFGYGKYIFYLASKVDQLNENVVLGLFTWDDAPEYNHREIDIEFSRFGEPIDDNSQFVVQPWDTSGNRHRFNTQLKGRYSTHSFEWSSGSIFFHSLCGQDTSSDSNEIIESWNYTGSDIPVPGNENARINLWLFEGDPPSDNKEVEVIIKKFEFVP